MKKHLLLLSILVFASCQILSRGFTVYNKANQKVWVRADGQLADSKQKNGIEIKDGYISVDKDKNVYIETGSGERGAEWYYNNMPKTIYYTYLKYASPDKLTIKDYNENYTMNQTAGYKKDEQKPLTKEQKDKKQAEDKAAAQKKKDDAEYASETKKINSYKKVDELFSYLDEKKKVLRDTNKDKKDEIKKLESYAIAALDQIVKKYNDQITNKKVKDTEFDINTFKVELNTIRNKINERIKSIKETPLVLANIHQRENYAYKEGKTYSIEEKTGSKSYQSILDAITTIRGKLGVAKESKQFTALTDEQIKKEKDFHTLRDKYLANTKKEIERLKLKEAAESYIPTGYKTKNDKNFAALEASITILDTKIDELKTAYKEDQASKAEKEKEARQAKAEKEKEEREAKAAKEKEEREAEITKAKEELEEKETLTKEKNNELEVEKKRIKKQEEKDAQEIKDMEIIEKAKIDAELESGKVEINSKQLTEDEKKAELEKLEPEKQTKLKELTKNIELKKIEQKTNMTNLSLEVEKNIKEKTTELENLNKELVTLKASLETLEKELKAIK